MDNAKLREAGKFLIDISGLRYIWYKINPPPKKETDKSDFKSPRTIIFWIFGIYVALFGIASQRYENKINKIENRASSILAQLSSSAAISGIPSVQKMTCPYEPNIFRPTSIFNSFFFETTYPEMVNRLKETVQNLKYTLETVNLDEAYLKNANLSKADLHGASLIDANLFGANLQDANLNGAFLNRANLQGANLQNAYLWGAVLRETNLQEANLENSDLREANLQGANLQDANLQGAWLLCDKLEKANLKGANLERAVLGYANLTGTKFQSSSIATEQFCKAATLYNAEFDPVIEKAIRKKCPALFEKQEN